MSWAFREANGWQPVERRQVVQQRRTAPYQVDVAREPDPYPKEVNAMSLDHWQRPTIANMLNGHIPIGELTCKVCLRRGSLYRFP
jgi:hypothetical protein